MLNILVVDDETPILDWLTYCIQRASDQFHIVGTATSGKEAYELVLRHKPDVVITDIKMPGMDGIELMREVKKSLPYTCFIVLTNYADFSYAKQAITFGAKEYLLKSEMRSADIAAALNKILQTRTSIRENKVHNVLPGGHIDLYELYRHYEDSAYCISFWEELGLNPKNPYCILGMDEDVDSLPRAFLLELAKTAGVTFCATARRQSSVYLLLQDTGCEDLARKAQWIGAEIVAQRSCNVGVGLVERDAASSVPAFDRVLVALSARFFAEKNGVFYYKALLEQPLLNRAQLRELQHAVLSALSLKKYDQAAQELTEWFGSFGAVGAEDMGWAADCCNRMVLSVEERYYQFSPEREENKGHSAILKTLAECRAACLRMVAVMHHGGKDGRSQPIDAALAYIHQNYNTPISLVEVASHIYRSPEYFCRLFKDEVGENFSVYLILYRLNRARELLHNTDLRIAEVGYQVGYSTPGYFSRLYKKYMGCTPEEERMSR